MSSSGNFPKLRHKWPCCLQRAAKGPKLLSTRPTDLSFVSLCPSAPALLCELPHSVRSSTLRCTPSWKWNRSPTLLSLEFRTCILWASFWSAESLHSSWRLRGSLSATPQARTPRLLSPRASLSAASSGSLPARSLKHWSFLHLSFYLSSLRDSQTRSLHTHRSRGSTAPLFWPPTVSPNSHLYSGSDKTSKPIAWTRLEQSQPPPLRLFASLLSTLLLLKGSGVPHIAITITKFGCVFLFSPPQLSKFLLAASQEIRALVALVQAESLSK